MKRQDGIALIASLLIMAAIMALGAGSLFLTTMNLRVAENSSTHAVARNNAEAGMEAALVKLKQDYAAATPRQFPASLTLPTSPDSAVTYQLSSYTTYTSGGQRAQARVVVVGTGPNNARYQTEALFGAGSSASTTAVPSFRTGFVSEGVVKINGNFETVNAGIHGNAGFDLNGNATFTNCLTTTPFTCTQLPNNAPAASKPVTAQTQETPPAAQVSYTCAGNGNGSSGLCTGGTPVNRVPKVTVGIPPYAAMRNDKLNDVSLGQKPTVFGLTAAMTRTGAGSLITAPLTGAGCTVTVTSATLANSYPAGAKVCVVPSGTGVLNVTIPGSANYSNITMIVKGDVTINGNSTFNNVSLLSMGTLRLGGNANLTSTRLFADTAVDINGNFRYNGSTTVASGGSLNINGNIEYTGSGSSNIELALMSVGDMHINGNSQTGSAPLRAALWSGRNANLNGNTRILGGISSVGSTDAFDLDVNGNSYVDGRGVFTNTDLPTTNGAVAGATVLSRR